MSGKKKNGGHLKMRNGIFEHVQKGWMDEQMYLAYNVMLHQCDWKTGEWTGSAARLREAIPHWSLATVKRVLNRLARGQYVDSQHVRGARGNYKVLINNYEPTTGPLAGKRIRKTETIDWRTAVRIDESGLTDDPSEAHQ
jgi:hypothetical protein